MAQLESRHWWFVGTRSIILSEVHRRIPRGSSLLDVGSGAGYTLSLLHPDFDCLGLDCSAEATALSREKTAAPTVQGSATQLPFAGNSFDAVLALDVLEHLDDDLLAAQQIYHVLKPGGTLIASVPAHPWLFASHDIALGHRRRYTADSLRKLLTAAGLQTLRLTPFNSILAPAIMAVRLLNRPFSTPDRIPQSDLKLPPPILNAGLTALLRWESKLLSAMNLPLGISLLVVATKPEEQ